MVELGSEATRPVKDWKQRATQPLKLGFLVPPPLEKLTMRFDDHEHLSTVYSEELVETDPSESFSIALFVIGC